jgi:NADPH-dependent curcumin reductase CurA
MNRQIILTSRPHGLPTASNFKIRTVAVPEPLDGQFILKNRYLGLAPAARLRMGEQASYAPPLDIGDVIYGQSVGEVIASRHAGFAVGERVMLINGGWQEYAVSKGGGAFKIDPALAHDSVWLGALGTSGMTAWVGLTEFGRLEASETVVVSAASGGVGSMVGQIARLRGCRVVGIAGGAAKNAHVVEDLGFDACVDYRSATFQQDLAAACPLGIDVYFDNVGGTVRDAAWPLMNRSGRIIVCGMIAEYNDTFGAGPSWFPVLTKRLTISGFLMSDHLHHRDAFVAEMSAWYKTGQISIREDITEGFENVPTAFIRMLSGSNFGKTIVKL